MRQITTNLAIAMHRISGVVEAIEDLQRLSGGATMESWSFDYAGRGYVLRRAPSLEMMEGRPFGHDVEAALVQSAFEAGVKAPEVLGILVPEDELGSGYIMRRAGGTANPADIMANPPASLFAEFAAELARIHTIQPSDNIAIPHMDIGEALAELKARFMQYGGDRPIIALAIRWCEDNIPAPASHVLVHGDYRMGNLMVDEDGLTAVLDWELAHWGDRHDDIAYGCLNVWRFGQVDKPAYGIASLEAFFAAYETAGGEAIDPERFRFWMIYRTLWWALGCLQMAEYWRSGADRSLERAVIGRRTSENELDLLMLLEEETNSSLKRGGGPPKVVEGAHSLEQDSATIAPSVSPDGLPPPRSGEELETGEPSAHEMLEAVREWISSDVKATAKGREKFMAAVAMNALGMVQREIINPLEIHDKPLCDQILAGEQDLATPGLLEKLRSSALTKLANDVPKYASLQKAREKWSK